MTRSFSDWLTATKAADFDELRTHVSAEPDLWAGISTLPQAQARIEALPGLTEQARRARQMDLARAFLAFEQAAPRRRSAGLLSFGLSVFALMVIVLGVIAFGIFSKSEPTLLDQLSDTETARGLITFIFALGVMSLALIIVSASFISDSSRSHSFDRAKEVFTSLVAILGTILGFYFGVGEAERIVEDAQAALGTPGTSEPENAPPIDQE
ncbi:hypothetical protein FIU97_05480 [Roseivivax sp. THAF40]|uniref:hypothetical protein n=1 Tax=unclassified Roseivivax TaxID=2639302 RepID=UPI00126812E4|nr:MULTISPECIES: hypothetical protein [unclassified Roseivivax]QFS82225.1 hypothetical protein FIV09_05220 [Roseivivax sp. THAF197b]QFT46025.1 hypothetical protein FIU97_05480 [Roseivivax sp. THAF40]